MRYSRPNIDTDRICDNMGNSRSRDGGLGCDSTQIDPIATISVWQDLNGHVVATWRDFERTGVMTPYQTLDWFEAWLERVAVPVGESPLIIMAHDTADRATLILPLVLCKRSFFRIARFAGDGHSNFNFPLLRPDVVFAPATMNRFFRMVARRCPEVDVLDLDALPRAWNETPNPLVAPGASRHTACASVIVLDEGVKMEAQLTASRRRRVRRNDSKLADFGVTLQRARCKADVEKTLQTYLAHKTAWFEARGLPNPFNEPGIIPFFTDLMSRPGSGAELHYLRAADDRIIAVASTLVSEQQVSLMFVSFDAASPYTRFSPGLHLIRAMVRQACDRGFKRFDFGLGEAIYKQSLGARPQAVFVMTRPMTIKGSLASSFIEMRRWTKIWLKSRPAFLATLLGLKKKCRFNRG